LTSNKQWRPGEVMRKQSPPVRWFKQQKKKKGIVQCT